MKEVQEYQKPSSNIRRRLHEIVFESDTKAGRFFDAVLIILIVFSALVVIRKRALHSCRLCRRAQGI